MLFCSLGFFFPVIQYYLSQKIIVVPPRRGFGLTADFILLTTHCSLFNSSNGPAS